MMRSWLLFWLCLVLNQWAIAFPANTRLGYSNCGSCHHSPTGGGVLNKYGMGTASEISSFPYNSSEPFYSKEFPLFMGGDLRYIYVNTRNREIAFPMQSDIEVGIDVYGLIFIGQLGLYGQDRKLASYRAYSMFRRGQHTWRVGHFAPAFGINEPDHYLPGRNLMGFDNRNGSLNLEYTYHGRKFGLNLTAVVGHQGKLFDSDTHQIYKNNIGQEGFTAQLNYFPHRTAFISISTAYLQNINGNGLTPLSLALSSILGTKDVYAKMEYAFQFDVIAGYGSKYQWWADLNFVVARGLTHGLVVRSDPNSFIYGNQLIWFPFTGVEFNLIMTRVITDFDDSPQLLGIMHLYF